MIKGLSSGLMFVCLLLSATALHGGKKVLAAMTKADEIAAQKSAEKTQLEIDKLRADIASAQDQHGFWESVKGWIAPLATLITGAGLIWKFVLGQEAYAHIEFTADINLIGEQNGRKIVELIAYVENKGSAKHQVNDVTFDLNGMSGGEIPKGSEKWQGETNFPDPLGAGSFRPNSLDFFFVDPSVKAKYSKIWSVPAETTFLMLHCHFIYPPRPLSYGPDGPSVCKGSVSFLLQVSKISRKWSHRLARTVTYAWKYRKCRNAWPPVSG
jgi:hypothetical protein